MYKDGGETFLHTERVSHIHSYCSFNEQKDEASLRTKTCLKSTFFTQEDAEKFERTETTRNREPDRSFQRQKNVYFLESFLSHNKHFRAEITITTTRHGDSLCPCFGSGVGFDLSRNSDSLDAFYARCPGFLSCGKYPTRVLNKMYSSCV
jgi:hypothetical protein